MDKLIIRETDRGRYAVRPMDWAGIWNEKGQIQESLNHLALFSKKEDAEKFVEWKTAEEQNKLLKLPYAINDTVYYLDDITPFEEMPIEGRISGFRVTWCRTIVIHITTNFNDEGCLADRNEDIDVVAEEFGKTVFLAREAAEAALEEMSE